MRVTLEEAFELCGGFGRFQLFQAILMILTMTSASYFLFSLPFLEKEPSYLCLNQGEKVWYQCKAEIFCKKSTVSWKYNWEDSETLDNLLVQFNLVCDAEMKIGLFGSFFLLGICMGSITLTRLGDIYGRKPIFIFGILLVALASFILYFMTNIITGYVLGFIMGFGVTAKQYVGFSYLVEMHPKKRQVLVGCMFFFYEALIFLFLTTFFGWINKSWYYILIPTLGFGVIGCLLMILMPESPRFLVSTKQYDRAR